MSKEVYVVSIEEEYSGVFFEKEDALREAADLLRINADESGWESLRQSILDNPKQTIEDFFNECMEYYTIEIETFVKKL